VFAADGKLYADSYTSGKIGYFTLPVTAISTPTIIATTPLPRAPMRLSFSPQGHLIVPQSNSPTVEFYAPPSFSSVAFTLTTSLVDPWAFEFSP
jgi:hypothetical protein